MIVGHIGGGAVGGGGYQIEKSLRLRASASAYLSRTPGAAGNRKTWTWSGWVKRGSSGAMQSVFSTSYIAGAHTNGAELRFNADKLEFVMVNLPGGLGTCVLTTTGVFTDPTAHYHIVAAYDTTQNTSSDRMRLFVNGVQIVAFDTVTYPPLDNATGTVNNTQLHEIGRITINGAPSRYLDGYLSEINFIDGHALTPNSFGEFNSDGVWIPKKYTGTYGTNGFYLPFSDGSSLANLTSDKSGNGNNWTANNVSLTAGAAYDWMEDTPTNNFAVLNAVHAGRSTLTNGNLTASGTTDLPTIIPDSGTWYFERGGVAQTWTPPAAFPVGTGNYNFGQRPWESTGPTGSQKTLCTNARPFGGSITTSGSFTGNANADGPFVWLNGNPSTMTINGNAVTWGVHADKTAGGFKVRTNSTSYNALGTNNFSVSITGKLFGDEVRAPNTAQGNQ